jgi:hypothetical protein
LINQPSAKGFKAKGAEQSAFPPNAPSTRDARLASLLNKNLSEIKLPLDANGEPTQEATEAYERGLDSGDETLRSAATPESQENGENWNKDEPNSNELEQEQIKAMARAFTEPPEDDGSKGAPKLSKLPEEDEAAIERLQALAAESGMTYSREEAATVVAQIRVAHNLLVELERDLPSKEEVEGIIERWRKSGKRDGGRPELANPGKTDGAREGVDAFDAAFGEPRTLHSRNLTFMLIFSNENFPSPVRPPPSMPFAVFGLSAGRSRNLLAPLYVAAPPCSPTTLPPGAFSGICLRVHSRRCFRRDRASRCANGHEQFRRGTPPTHP